jgi:IS30 family transposase
MEQGKSTEDKRKGKHLTRYERIMIEGMLVTGYPVTSIAATLGRHQRTIEREIKRGSVEHLDTELRKIIVYSSDRGQDVHELNATAKGPDLKLGSNTDMVEFVRSRIVDHKESPDVVAYRMREAGMEGAVCTKTLYNYIEQDLIDGVDNESLWEKRKRRKQLKRRVHRAAKRISKGLSIERRPDEVENREEFGHWEMDLVVGPTKGSNAALLTLIERKHRQLITRKLPDKTQASVLKALKSIEKEYGSTLFRKIFKSITVDNGSEFLDFKALESSAFSKKQRTQIFYAHPYSSWERGSNENANRIIRRFIAKGIDIARITKKRLKEIEQWINCYPRKLLNYMSPNELFMTELKAIS